MVFCVTFFLQNKITQFSYLDCIYKGGCVNPVFKRNSVNSVFQRNNRSEKDNYYHLSNLLNLLKVSIKSYLHFWSCPLENSMRVWKGYQAQYCLLAIFKATKSTKRSRKDISRIIGWTFTLEEKDLSQREIWYKILNFRKWQNILSGVPTDSVLERNFSIFTSLISLLPWMTLI